MTCVKCHKDFSRKDGLVRHERNCEGPKQATSECSSCRKTFSRRDVLLRHQKTCTPAKQAASVKCRKCLKGFAKKEIALLHEKSCPGGKDLFRCSKCRKTFARKDYVARHEKNCSKLVKSYSCIICSHLLSSVEELRKHNLIHQKSKDLTNKDKKPTPQYKCRTCACNFPSRRELYRHHATQHGRGGLQQVPWEGVAPWEDEDGQTVDAGWEGIYNENRTHILRPHEDGAVRSEFNFPTNDFEGGIKEMMNALRSVFKQQSEAFKLNISLGLILKNKETDEYRYFIPYNNTSLFEENQTVTSIHSLQNIEQLLRNMDIEDYAHKQRPDTKWRVHMITNMMMFVYKTSFPLGHGLLPSYIKNKKSIIGLDVDLHCHNKPYEDHLCAFRCLAVHHNQGRMEEAVQVYYDQWRGYMVEEGRHTNIPEDSSEFSGVDMKQLPHFERCFNLRVTVCRLDESGAVTPVYHPTTTFKDRMYLNIFEQHLSYIKKFKTYAKKFQCPMCSRHFKTLTSAKTHLRICSKVTKFKYPGGLYKPADTVFDQLAEHSIHVPKCDQFFPYYIVYDFESLLKLKPEQNSQHLKWTTQHVPISVSVCSNVPNFKDAKCIVNANLNELMDSLVKYLSEISDKVESLAKRKWSTVIEQLKSKMEEWEPERKEEDDAEGMETNENEPPTNRFKRAMAKPNVYQQFQQQLENDEWGVNFNEYEGDEDDEEDDEEEEEEDQENGEVPKPEDVKGLMHNIYKKLYGRFMKYCCQVPVIGFNSSRYDLNLVKCGLAKALGLGSDPSSFTVKKNNTYLCISSENFKFLDITQYLAPGCSYSKFLKAFQVEEQKGYFPYEWLDDVSKLEETSLPAYSEFYSKLKGENVLDIEYQDWLSRGQVGDPPPRGTDKYLDLQWLWLEQNMETFQDYLVYYNNLDVAPFVTAIEHFQQFYIEKHIDVFKTAISVPGIARQMLFRAAKEQAATFTLFSGDDEDLHKTVMQNIVGGPSIIFNRHHKAGETYIRGNEEKKCKRVIGKDANALYLNSIGKPMPTGNYCRLTSNGGSFTSTPSNPKYMSMFYWMDLESQRQGIEIKHKLNSGQEKRVGPYLVDGYDEANNHVYEVNILFYNKFS